MKVDEILNDLALLEANFQRLLSGMSLTGSPRRVVLENIKNMPTTHTFGWQKVVGEANTPEDIFYPYKDILFNDEALLSDAYRTKFKSKKENALARTMTRARAFGLDEYVFAYLGVHEYFYAKSRGMESPAFGAFISVKADDLPGSNATLYDLGSPLCGTLKEEDMTISTTNARELTAMQIDTHFMSDFFNYWICHDYVAKNYHDVKMWEHKREFHFKNHITIKHFDAVIWPIEMILNPDDQLYEPRSGVMDEIQDFKQSHQDIKIYRYQWHSDDGLARFSYASYIASLYPFMNGGALMEEVDFEFQFRYRHEDYN